MSDVLDIRKHNAYGAARVIFETTKAHDIEERIGEYIYEASLERERLEAVNTRLRKAGEAYVAAAIKYHQCSLIRKGEECHQCFTEYEKAHHEWREAYDE